MEILGYVNSLPGAILISLGIFVFFYWQRRKFLRECSALVQHLQQTQAILTEEQEKPFIERYETCREKIKDIPIIGKIWMDYCDRFVFVIPTFAGEQLVASAPASAVFGETVLVGKCINIRWYRSLPNILTGLGIAGTFLGLTIGLILANFGISSQNTKEMLQSLNNLIGGASTAFFTSIAGVSCSLVFTWTLKKQEQRINRSLSDLANLIETLIPPLTPERMLWETRNELQKHTDILGKFTDDLALNIANALDEKVAQRITPAFERLIEVVEGLRLDRQMANEEQLALLLRQFQEHLTQSAGSQIQTLAESLATLSAQLNGVAERVAQSQSHFETGIAAAVATLQEGIADLGETLRDQQEELRQAYMADVATLQETLTNTMQQLRQYADELATTMSGATATLDQQVGNAAHQLSQAFEEGIHRFNEAVHELHATADRLKSLMQAGEEAWQTTIASIRTAHEEWARTYDHWKELNREWKAMVDGVRLAIDQLAATGHRVQESGQQMHQTATQLQQTLHAFRQHSEALTRLWHEQRSRFEQLDTTMANVFKQYGEGMQFFTQSIVNIVKQVDSEFSKSVNLLYSALQELSEFVEEFKVANRK